MEIFYKTMNSRKVSFFCKPFREFVHRKSTGKFKSSSTIIAYEHITLYKLKGEEEWKELVRSGSEEKLFDINIVALETLLHAARPR